MKPETLLEIAKGDKPLIQLLARIVTDASATDVIVGSKVYMLDDPAIPQKAVATYTRAQITNLMGILDAAKPRKSKAQAPGVQAPGVQMPRAVESPGT